MALRLARSKSKLRTASWVVAVAVAVAGAPSWAGTTTWSGNENGTFESGSGTSIGLLALAANLDLTDNLGTNTGSSNMVTTDDWSFSVPSMATLGATVTGYELDLTQLTFAGTLDSVQLYSGTPGSGTLLTTGTLIGGTFDGLTYDLSHMGSYYVQVVSTLTPSSAGSYTGTLLVASIPEPDRWQLLALGAGTLCLLGWLRGRRSGA